MQRRVLVFKRIGHFIFEFAHVHTRARAHTLVTYFATLFRAFISGMRGGDSCHYNWKRQIRSATTFESRCSANTK